jgi:hypothetical protein
MQGGRKKRIADSSDQIAGGEEGKRPPYPTIYETQHSCRGPSAPWPARQTTARKKKPATPVGMTVLGHS